MEGSHQEYPALLRSLSPGQAIAVLENRIQLVGQVNVDVADWLSERRRVEEAYAQGLKKLASRRPSNLDLLGVFRTPWQTIVSSVESLANSHSTLATRIQTDVEVPLREFQSKNREMKAITSIQGNIASIAKDVDVANKKASKLNAGKPSANKVANATSDVEAANLQWDSQAPYAFETLQALDESRVSHLRDVLTQLETHEVDQVERSRVTAEACLNALLNIDTSEEISTFVARTSAGISSTLAPGRESRGSDSASNSRAPGAEIPTLRSTPSRPSASRLDEDQTDRPSPFASSVRSGVTTSTMGPPPQPKKSGFGGLRRLGTVLSRPGKDSKGMERIDRASSPEKEKRSRASRNPLRRGPSSKQDMQTIPDDVPEPPPRVNIPSSPPQLDAPVFSTPTNNGIERKNNEVNGERSRDAPTPNSGLPSTNGIVTGRDPAPSSDVPAGSSRVTERDAEGFSVPSSNVDDITRAQQEAAAGGSETEQPAFKLDIKSKPIQEDDPDAQTAFSSVANTLRAQAQQGGPLRKSNTNRGRRDVRNTVFVPSGPSAESSTLAGLVGIRTPGEVGGGSPPIAPLPSSNIQNSPIPTMESTRGADAQSIRSAYSMSSIAHPSITHPHMSRPGLNGSVVETVSATFSQSQVTKAVVIGELALQHNVGDSPSSGSEIVRLDNFPVLEKVAPNPTFITQRPSASGEYSVNLSHIIIPTVAFKYQVHLDETNLAAHAPISITPNWKIEPTQASMILTYAFNPVFVSPAKRSVTLKNVTVAVAVENAKALSCQSKPAGIFAKEKSLIYWKLGDITLDGYAESPQKLLARFTTEGEAKAGSVEVRWEINGDEASSLGSGLGLSTLSSTKEEGGSDPFADESTDRTSSTPATWLEVPVTRRIISGKYNAS